MSTDGPEQLQLEPGTEVAGRAGARNRQPQEPAHQLASRDLQEFENVSNECAGQTELPQSTCGLRAAARSWSCLAVVSWHLHDPKPFPPRCSSMALMDDR